jgi:NADH-quinone oxidoreductase subunit J
MDLIFFLFLSVVCVASATNILVQRHPIYSALSLVLTFISLAGIYLQMHAEFIAVMQIVIYTGAIMVLFVFVIMLLNARAEDKIPNKLTFLKYLGIPLVVLLVGVVGLKVFESLSGESIPTSSILDVTGNTQAIGKLLYTQYALPFEVTSLLLLVAIVGAIVMAKKEL